MKLVVGLGNPGGKYAGTRHNVGFMVIDEIIVNYIAGPKYNKKFESILYSLDNVRTLAKPQTFMNASGKVVNRLANFYKLKPNDLLVVHDDVDLEFGVVKHQFGRGAAGHKGVVSVIESLGSDQFHRVRVGVGRPEEKIEIDKWVLRKFTEDKEEVQKVIKKSSEVTINWLKNKS